jgi:tetratricopeptide (TPR) repeat protein
MERSKHLILFIIMFLGYANLQASHKKDIYKAYITNDMTLWASIIDDMHLHRLQSNSFKMELINYQYGYVAWCIGNGKKDLADKYLTMAEKSLSELEKSGYNISLVHSYQSAFNGFRIGLNLLKAPFIGLKSIDFAKLAIQTDGENPYGYIQYGNSQYYMPAIFGGSKTVALEYFKKAEKLMERHKMQIHNDWNYLSLLTLMAQAYTETNNYDSAKAYYLKILKIEPNFLWVKNELYPQFLKTMNNKI